VRVSVNDTTSWSISPNSACRSPVRILTFCHLRDRRAVHHDEIACFDASLTSISVPGPDFGDLVLTHTPFSTANT